MRLEPNLTQDEETVTLDMFDTNGEIVFSIDIWDDKAIYVVMNGTKCIKHETIVFEKDPT